MHGAKEVRGVTQSQIEEGSDFGSLLAPITRVILEPKLLAKDNRADCALLSHRRSTLMTPLLLKQPFFSLLIFGGVAFYVPVVQTRAYSASSGVTFIIGVSLPSIGTAFYA